MAHRATPTPQEVAAFLQWDPATDSARITPHLAAVTAFTRSYTRGRGFTDTTCAEEIWATIVTATARSVSNPDQATRKEIGGWSEVPAKFEGFTIAEQLALNEHRRRTA